MEGIAEIEGDLGVLRRLRQRFIQSPFRLREIPLIPIRNAEIEAVRSDRGFKLRSGAQQFDGLGELAHFAQHRAQIGHDAGISGFQQQGLPIGRHRLRTLSAQLPADPEIVPGVEKIRLQFQRRFIDVNRLVPTAKCLQRLPQHELIARFIGDGRDGLLEQSKRGVRLSVLQFQEAAAIDRKRVRRRSRQHLLV